MKLLNRNNAKLLKARTGYILTGLAIAPHKLGGTNVCPKSTPGCRAACCLWFAGRTVTSVVRKAMIDRAQYLTNNRAAFIDQLHRELINFAKLAERKALKPVVRLNVSSDLDWTDVIAMHPTITFFDYTKVFSRALSYVNDCLPDNYHVTYSQNERSKPDQVQRILYKGGNVAQVYNVEYVPQHKRFGPLPKSVDICGRSYPVIDGDKHDYRLPELDGTSTIVGLRLKGNNASKRSAVKTGFAI